MATVEVCFIGDLHLGKLDRLFVNYGFDGDDMIYKSLAYVFNYAKENGIKYIFLLGDIFDNPFPTQAQQQRLLRFFLKYPRIKVIAIGGNHDYSTEQELSLEMVKFSASISDQLNHVSFHLQPELITLEDIPISLLPWPHCKTLEKGSVNIAHVEISGSLSDSGQRMKKGYEISDRGLYVIGHLHRRQAYQDRVFYPGTLFQTTFGEPLPKGFCHATIERSSKGKLTWDMQWIQVQPPYELYNVKINELKDFKQVTKPNPDKIKQYKLFVKKGIEIPIGFLTEYHNVIEANGKLSNKELKSLESGDLELALASTDMAFDIFEDLEPFLEKEGHDEAEIKIALEYAHSYLAGKGLKHGKTISSK